METSVLMMYVNLHYSRKIWLTMSCQLSLRNVGYEFWFVLWMQYIGKYLNVLQ